MILRRTVFVSFLVSLGMMLWPLAGATAASDPQVAAQPASADMILYLLTWMLPLGVALVAVGNSEPARAHHVATSLPWAFAAALCGYALCGFALQFGSFGWPASRAEAGALGQWAPLGPGWSLAGLRGFAFPLNVSGEEAQWLFIAQLPLVTTATLIPLVTLSDRIPRSASLFLALFTACFGYPLMGHWVRGGGWLSHLGVTLGLGQGFVDYGLGSLHLVGAGITLTGLLAFRRRGISPAVTPAPPLPPAYLPLNVLLGAFLALVGWLAMMLSQPLVPTPPNLAALMFKTLSAVTASIAATMLYGWLVRGEAEPGLVGRGMLATLVALSAGLPYLPLWAVLLVGGLNGLLLAPAMYVFEQGLKFEDRAAVLSVHGMAALGGLLAVGLFADGELAGSSADALTSHVAGYFAFSAAGRDPSQLYAQLIGLGAVLVLAMLVPYALFTLLAQAYAMPPTMYEKARARARQIRQEQEARERQKRQGRALHIGQRGYITYLRLVAAAPRRLHQRPKRVYPSIGSSHAPHPRYGRTGQGLCVGEHPEQVGLHLTVDRRRWHSSGSSHPRVSRQRYR